MDIGHFILTEVIRGIIALVIIIKPRTEVILLEMLIFKFLKNFNIKIEVDGSYALPIKNAFQLKSLTKNVLSSSFAKAINYENKRPNRFHYKSVFLYHQSVHNNCYPPYYYTRSKQNFQSKFRFHIFCTSIASKNNKVPNKSHTRHHLSVERS